MKKQVGALVGAGLALTTLLALAPSAEAGTSAGQVAAQKAALKSTKVTATRAKYHAHQWKVTVHLTRAGKAWAHKVTLQVQGNGVWMDVRAANTGPHGYLSFTTNPGEGTSYPLRMHLAATHTTKAANSATFHLPVR